MAIKPQKRSGATVWLRVSILAPIVLGMGILTGCSGRNSTSAGDPLLGEQFRKGGTPAAVATETKSPVPPVPRVEHTFSNAALATGIELPGSRPLAIPVANGHLNASPRQPNIALHQTPRSNSPWSVDPSQTTSPPALNKPIPVPVKQSKNVAPKKIDANVVPVTAYSQVKAETKKPPTFDEVLTKLKKHGVVRHRVERTPGGVKMICTIVNSQDQNSLRMLEATAADPTAAAQAILQKIESR